MRLLDITFVRWYPETVIAIPTILPQIREEALRDPRYPVHRIANRLRPYLKVLIEQVRPEQVILFGSYAYGEPTRNSDVDLLVIAENGGESPLKQRVRIRQAWWDMPRSEALLPFDLLVVSPERHRERLATAAGFYDTIVQRGLRLV
jgi:predicted nucleotidyltransferase